MRRVFDRYEYDHGNIIGRGGMGTVYKGVDLETSLPVAIKYLDPLIVQSNPSMVERFHREGEALRDLNHPNIVKMLGAGQCENEHYIVMEYVSGGSLRDVLDKQPKLIVQRALYIALDLADALTRAHRLDILHRDIKPANVLVAEDGTPRLTDFGVARVGAASNMTAEGSLVGTLAYLSPESLTGQPIDERHDIWAFGVLLFEMLAGHRPYQHESVAPLISAITMQPLPDLEEIRPELPISIVDLIYRMLEKDPNSRIRSVRTVGAELEAIIQGAAEHPLGVATSQARFGSTSLPTPLPGMTLETDAVRAATPKLYNFPAETTPFVGRERELTDLVALIDDPSRRLLTLVGPGGTGKTRLAMALGERVLDRFPDGIYFVPLEGVDDASHVSAKIAETLGLEMGGSAPPMEQVKAFLREKQALLLLDNLEQLVSGAQQLAEGMDMMPHITVVATSRERLRLRGEQVYEVDSMQIPPLDLTDVEDLCAYPSMQLFVNNAKRNAPDFDLTPENAPDVNRIINLVQGMPLGIELAAGWLEILPVNEIVTEIEQSLDFLETDLRDVPERHRSLRAVFDHSWNLMSSEEQDAFMKLSLFRDGFDRAAALEVTGTSLRTLTVLGNKSLVFRAPDGRFSVPKLLRQYAEEQFFAHCNNGADVLQKYVYFYAKYADSISEIFTTPREHSAAEAFEKEGENIRHAWKLALKHNHIGALDLMMRGLYEFVMSRSMFLEGLILFDELITTLQARGMAHTETYWRGRVLQSTIMGRRGDYKNAEAIAAQTVEHFKDTDDTFYYAYAFNSHAYSLMMLGNHDLARTQSQRNVEITEPGTFAYAMACGNLGYIEFLAGNLETAKEIYEKLINSTYTRDSSPTGYAFASNNLGEIFQAIGKYDRAQQQYEIAYQVFKEINQRRGMAFTTNNLAGIYQLQGNMERAKELYDKAHRLNRETGDQAGIGHSLSALGNIAFYYEQRFEAALGYYREAMQLRKEIGDRAGYGRSAAEVGMTLYMLGRIVEARPYFEDALEIGEALNDSVVLGLANIGMGGVNLYAGRGDVALGYFQKALATAQQGEFQSETMFTVAATAVIFAERDINEHAAQLIGFVDKHSDAVDARFTKPLLENLKYALRNKMGASYTTAYERGQSLGIENVMDIVANA